MARDWEVEEKKRVLAVTAMPQTLTFSNASRSYLEDCKARMAPNTFKERLRCKYPCLVQSQTRVFRKFEGKFPRG